MVRVTLQRGTQSTELQYDERQQFTAVEKVQEQWPRLKQKLKEIKESTSNYLGQVRSFYSWYTSEIVSQLAQAPGTFKVLVGSQITITTENTMSYISLQDHEQISQIFSTCASAKEVATDLAAKRWISSLETLDNIDISQTKTLNLSRQDLLLEQALVNSIDAYSFYSLVGIDPEYDVGSSPIFSMVQPKMLSSGAIDTAGSKAVLEAFGITSEDTLRTARSKVESEDVAGDLGALLNKEGQSRWFSALLQANNAVTLTAEGQNWIEHFKTGADDVIKYLPPAEDVVYRGITSIKIHYAGFPIWNELQERT